jgi:hypothetical protein
MIGLPNWLNKFRKVITSGGGGGGGGGGTFSLIDHKFAAQTASTTATTAAIDSTGAKLIVISVGSIAAVTVTDSKGNTLTPLTSHTVGGYITRIYYCISPGSVGSGHTWSAQGTGAYPTLMVSVWSYAGSTPTFDNENGNTSSVGTSLQTGTASSSGGTPLVITGFTWQDAGDTLTIDSSFTITDQGRNNGTGIGGGHAYLLQSGGGVSVNPTWSLVGGAQTNLTTAIAAFK